jgi:hypothetical protein
MDASDYDVNQPHGPSKAVRFTRAELSKDVVSYAAGGLHAAAPGIHAPISVALTRDGEVWTWGLMLGDPRSPGNQLLCRAIRFAHYFGYKGYPTNAAPVIHQAPWRLRHLEP